MELQPDQVYAQLGPIVFGAVDEFGVDWSLQALDGWGATASTRRLEQKPRQAGSWASRGFAVGRSVALSGKIFAPTAPALSDAIDRLNAAADINSVRLTVVEAGRARWVDVGRSDDVLTKWLTATEATWSVQVESTESRKFAADLSGSSALPSTFGGLIIPGGGEGGSAASSFTEAQFSFMANRQGFAAHPNGATGNMELYTADGERSNAATLAVLDDIVGGLTIPFTIDAVTVTGQVSITNPGNETGPVRLRIDGPCRGPVVTHVSTGAQLIFSSSLVLGAGEWLEVDMEARSVLANGQATRAPWITSRGWSGFTPGPNTWTFTADSFDPEALLTVVATPAWK